MFGVFLLILAAMAAAISPQPLAVGETIQNNSETVTNNNTKQSYAATIQNTKTGAIASKLELSPVHMIHGEPTVEFTVEEVNKFTIEEGLHQAVILKFSYGKPDIQQLRQIIPKQFDVKGNCNVGQLEYRHILVRFDLFENFVQVLSRTAGYVKEKGDEFFFRTFPWTMGFNPREETSKAVVWISFPDLPANFFAKKSLLSIASAVGKPLAVDKATQDRTRPSTARVKVLIDLMDKHPQRVKINIVDMKSGKSVEYYQKIVFENIPKYCTYCKHQGHAKKICRWMIEESKDGAAVVDATEDLDNFDKMQGNAREYLNAKKTMQQNCEARNQIPVGQQELQSTDAQTVMVTNSNVENCVADGTSVVQIDGRKQIGDVEQQGILISKEGKNSTAQTKILGDGSMLDKGPQPPSRDVPARIALARISNAVNPIVKAYDKLAAAAAILVPGASSKGAAGHVEEAGPVGKNQIDSAVATGSRSDHAVTDYAEATVQIGKDNKGAAAGARPTGASDPGSKNAAKFDAAVQSSKGLAAVEQVSKGQLHEGNGALSYGNAKAVNLEVK